MNKRVYTLVGRGIDRFYSKVEAERPFYVGELGAVGAGYVLYDNKPDWIEIVNDTYDEDRYLDLLVAEKQVERSPEKQIALWEKKAGRRVNNANPSFMTPDTTLLVLSKIILAEERERRYSFLIPRRVSTPDGIKEDEYVYYLKDYTCRKGSGERVRDDSCFTAAESSE